MKTRTGKATGVRGIQRLGTDRAGRQKWRLRVKYRDPATGIYRDVEKRVVAERLRDASVMRMEWIRELETLPDPAQTASNLTLGSVIDAYLLARNAEWKPATKRNTKAILGGLASLREVPLGDIKPAMIVSILEKKKLSPATWNLQKSVIGGLFAWAITQEMLASNPADKIQRKKKSKKYDSTDPGHLSQEQVSPFLEWLRNNRPQYYPLALLGLTTGVRSGSLRVLRPEDIRDGYVHVIRGLSGAGQIVDTTKTGDHQRIPVLPDVEHIIRKYWDALPAYKQAEGWLFPSESGGIISEPALNAAIKAASEAVGVRMTTHGLRRTAAHLLRQTVEIGVSKTITGHSGDEMFLYYSVAEEKERREAVEKAFGALLGAE